MSAAPKNLISQLMPATAHPAPSVFLEDLGALLRTIDLSQVRQLSRFLPVIVLMPADSAAHLTTSAAGNPTGQTSRTSELPEPLGTAITHGQTKIREADFLFGDVKVNFSSMEVSRLGELVMLTVLEFKTLRYLAQNLRRVISRDELLNQVWGYEHYPCTRTVDNHILRLRQKLERDPSRPIHFRTVHGAGYKFLP